MPANLNVTFVDRHLELADELVDQLASALPPPIAVSRAFAPEIKYRTLTGRRLWVIPITTVDPVRLARRRVLGEYRTDVLYTHRYEPPADAGADGPVPRPWIDQECGWVLANVYDFLNDKSHLADRLLGALWPEKVEMTVKCDQAELEFKVFASKIETAYREGRRG